MNSTAEPTTADEKTYCTVHPTVETGLRCNRCGRYMCLRCAVRTPVGYRCKECVNQQQDTFYNSTARDDIVAFVVSLLMAIPMAYVLNSYLFFVIILGLPAGGLVGEVVFRAVGKRRGRLLWIYTAAGVAAGTLVAAFFVVGPLLSRLTDPRIGRTAQIPLSALLPSLLPILFPLIVFGVLCASAAAARLRYGK